MTETAQHSSLRRYLLAARQYRGASERAVKGLLLVWKTEFSGWQPNRGLYERNDNKANSRDLRG